METKPSTSTSLVDRIVFLLAQRVEYLLIKTQGTMYVKNPVINLKSDIKLDIDKEKANSFGIPTVYIDRLVHLAVAEFKLGNFSDENSNDYDIVLTSSKYERATLDVFDNLFVNNYQGFAIPLTQLTTLKLESSPLTINHYNKIRTVSVSAFVMKGYLAANVINDVITQMDNFRLPQGYSYKIGGEFESRQETFGGLMPIAISTNPLLSPLAIVIIGGLLSSTLLSRIITPVIYKLLPPAI